MTRLEIDERWGQACIGYHVQARPDGNALEALRRLQEDVVGTSPVALNLVPADALHLSVATLVPAQSLFDVAELQWSRVEPDARRALLETLQYGGIVTSFRCLHFARHAIVLRTPDQPAALSRARSKFGAVMASLGMEFPRYDQTHITIARYADSVLIDDAALQGVARRNLVIRIFFEPCRLVRERRYPSLQIDAL